MEDPHDNKYMLKHLSDYIDFQLGQGYEADDISLVLAKYGYKKAVIDDLLEKAQANSSSRRKKPRQTSPKEMNQELYAYLHNMLVNFIVKEKEQGYSIQAIRKALLNYGHNPEIVSSAIASSEKGENEMKEDSKKMNKKAMHKSPRKAIRQNVMPKIRHASFGIPAGILFFILVIILFSFVIFIGIETEDDILLIMLSFFPALLSLTVVYVTILQLRSRRSVNMMALFGIALTVLIFIAMLQLKSPIQKLSDHNLVLVLNVLISFILGSLLVIFSRLPKLEKKDDEEPIPIEHHKPNSDEKLGAEIDHGSKSIIHETKELENIIGQGDDSEIKKIPERILSARRRSKRRLKIKPID